jgi:hypothetical protein
MICRHPIRKTGGAASVSEWHLFRWGINQRDEHSKWLVGPARCFRYAFLIRSVVMGQDRNEASGKSGQQRQKDEENRSGSENAGTKGGGQRQQHSGSGQSQRDGSSGQHRQAGEQNDDNS